MHQAVYRLLVVEMEHFSGPPSPMRRDADLIEVSCTKLPVLKYFRNLEGGGALVAWFTAQSELSFELVRALFLCVVELKTASSVGDTLYTDRNNTGRNIICREQLLRGLESCSGVLYFAVSGCEQNMVLEVFAARLRYEQTADQAVRWMRQHEM